MPSTCHRGVKGGWVSFRSTGIYERIADQHFLAASQYPGITRFLLLLLHWNPTQPLVNMAENCCPKRRASKWKYGIWTMRIAFITTMALLCVMPGLLHAATAIISNAEPRRDAQGNILDAHDGCLEYFEGRFYLYGTRYGKTDGFGKTNRYVCYSSPDLTTWTAHGEVIEDAPPLTYYRPYVKFNKRSGKYVMWYNADNQYGVALSARPSGPFVVMNPNARLKFSERGIGDMGLFVDDDGTGYLAYTVGVGGDFGVKVEPIPHHQICVEKLNPDYLGTTQKASAFVAGNCESPAMFKRNNIYYLLFDNTCCRPDGSGVRVYTALPQWGRSLTAETSTSRRLPLAACHPLGLPLDQAGPTVSSRPSRRTGDTANALWCCLSVDGRPVGFATGRHQGT